MSDSWQASSQEDEDLHLAKGRLMLRLSSCLVPINTQGKEAFAKELPMENKGMRFQKLFFQ